MKLPIEIQEFDFYINRLGERLMFQCKTLFDLVRPLADEYFTYEGGAGYLEFADFWGIHFKRALGPFPASYSSPHAVAFRKIGNGVKVFVKVQKFIRLGESFETNPVLLKYCPREFPRKEVVVDLGVSPELYNFELSPWLDLRVVTESTDSVQLVVRSKLGIKPTNQC